MIWHASVKIEYKNELYNATLADYQTSLQQLQDRQKGTISDIHIKKFLTFKCYSGSEFFVNMVKDLFL